MSLKDRMAKMKGILGLEAAAPLAQIDEVGEDAKLRNQKTGPRTAPGGMLVFRAHMKEHEVTVKALEEKLAQFSGGVRTLKLDPALIDESKWANRHQSNFDSPAFDKFKDEIAHAGGNIQPILVRLAKDRYEVVFFCSSALCRLQATRDASTCDDHGDHGRGVVYADGSGESAAR